jgi:GcrA cell cycle regulator
MSWTDDRVSVLRKLWGEGRTAAEIAKELGGVTRNAVIGKAHRLKLSNRVSPIQQNKKPAVKVVTGERKVPEAANTSVVSVIKQAVRIKPEIRTGDLMSLLELKPRMCRWPVGDPREEGFGFCGCESISGLPYCSDHAKVAYQAATRNRILQAEQQVPRQVEEREEYAEQKQASA